MIDWLTSLTICSSRTVPNDLHFFEANASPEQAKGKSKKKRELMAQALQLKSPSRQIFRNNIRSRKRRAPEEEYNPCKQHLKQYSRGFAYPQTDSECKSTAVATAPRTDVRNVARSRPTSCLSAYMVGGQMGKGNYGVVFKGRHLPTNDMVAIKCLQSDPYNEGVPSTTLRKNTW